MQYSLYTWNVNGIRAVSKKGFLEWFKATQPDVLGVQEIKADDEKMSEWWQAVSGQSLVADDSTDLFGDVEVTPVSPLEGVDTSHLLTLDGKVGNSYPFTKGSNQNGLGDLEFSGKNEGILKQVQDDDVLGNNPQATLDPFNRGMKKKPKKSDFENTGIFDNYDIVWLACSIKKGYSGTAIFYRKDKFKDAKVSTGLGVQKFDDEGRITILDTQDFVVINGYYPQGSREGRIPFKLEFYNEVLKKVQDYQKQGKKVMLCGDLNTTVADIDLARPKENRKTTGCLPEEREVLENLKKSNLLDAFRHFYPDKVDEYSYWDQISRARDRNVGWRIDYFLVDTGLIPNLKECRMHQNVFGSDHCPVSITLTI